MFNPSSTLSILETVLRPDGMYEVLDPEVRELRATALVASYRGRLTREQATKLVPNSVPILARREDGSVSGGVTVEPCNNMPELDEYLAVDPEALFGDKAREIVFPVCVNAQAFAPHCDYIALRAAALNVASALRCTAQYGFNAVRTGIPASVEPYGYTLTEVPAGLDYRKINTGVHMVTELPAKRFRVVAADIAASMAGGRLRSLDWDRPSRSWLDVRGSESWL